MTRPCLVAGCPAPAHRSGPRCQTHQRIYDAERNHRRTEYQGPWKRRSQQARALEPWCHCGGCPNCAGRPCQGARLTLDHEHAQVECMSCNAGHRRPPS